MTTTNNTEQPKLNIKPLLLTEQELSMLLNILDALVKSVGLNAIDLAGQARAVLSRAVDTGETNG
jgi:hypothetical protein